MQVENSAAAAGTYGGDTQTDTGHNSRMVNTVVSPPRPGQWNSLEGVKAELKVDGVVVRYVGSGTSGSTADAAAVRTDYVRHTRPARGSRVGIPHASWDIACGC